MKVSLRWLFEHIDASWQSCDVQILVKRFIESVAEVEEVHELALDQACFALGQVTASLDTEVRLNVPEWKIDCKVAARVGAHVGDRYLLYRENSNDLGRWAMLADLGSGKDGLVPALFVDEKDFAGTWKKKIAWTDTILVIDNKSITHRPDMWGHRGFAREVAALLNMSLKPLTDFCTPLPTIGEGKEYKAPKGSISSVIHSSACSRFATLSFHTVTVRPSLLMPTCMLARVDARPIDTIVDLTNYVMLDLGQPLHAFDAAKLDGAILGPRNARDGENVVLLDGQKITLSHEDLVIADEQKVLGLAGIMGGDASGVSTTTQNVIIEAAHFDAATIRLSATRHKLRTEASARFEKTLDPNMNVVALERCARVCHDWQLPVHVADAIVTLGDVVQPGDISLTHTDIEARLGLELQSIKIVTLLENLDFNVQLRVVEGETEYHITVPTFRSTKDIKIAEDIIEEIGRSLGYTSIAPVMPLLPAEVKDLHALSRVRLLKRVMSSGLSMRELYSYGLCDEAWLQELGWQPEQAVEIKNPISEQWRRAVTTLVPALLKAVKDNSIQHDCLRFFEWACVWRNAQEIIEKKALAAIFYDKSGKLSFYDVKAELQKLFDALSLTVSFKRVDEPVYPWYMPYQTAQIIVDGGVIGSLGMVHSSYMHHFGNGVAALVELDGDFLLQYKAPLKRFVPFAKVPSSARDVSLLVPLSLESARVQSEIANADERIIHVSLVDFFEKAEWADKRSLTFRYVMQDPEKTLTKEEADVIEQGVITKLVALGVTVR